MSNFIFHKYEIRLYTSFMVLFAIYVLYFYHKLGITQAIQLKTSYLGMRDSHDIQWQAFRNNFPIMIGIALAWRYLGDIKYSYIIGSLICLFSFRADAILYFCILIFYYGVSKYLYKNKKFQVIIWILIVLTIFINEYSNRFRVLSDQIEKYIIVEWFKNSNHIIHWASILNMSLLKLLSFGTDYHRNYFKKDDLNKHYQRCKNCSKNNICLKARDLFDPPELNFKNFLNYILFPCTFLAGPPLSYNNFHSFTKKQMKCQNPLWRFLFVFITFEIFQVLFPSCKPQKSNTLFQLEMISIFNLVFIWYKFINIWRWAKLWCYYEGVQVVDNISRCIFNNYGFQGFWRMWHRGFNIWLIRYLYIPLGGKKHFYSYIFVFLFVAFWHDSEMKLLYWALIILLFMIPQLYIKKLVRDKYSHLYKYQWFKYGSAFLASIYIYLMCIANLIGFGFGPENLMIVLIKIYEQIFVTFITLIIVTIAVILMYYVRHQQKEDIGY